MKEKNMIMMREWMKLIVKQCQVCWWSSNIEWNYDDGVDDDDVDDDFTSIFDDIGICQHTSFQQREGKKSWTLK